EQQALRGLFFFSSRRRHTRSDRDWSSDVCSSDLQLLFREHSLSAAGVVVASYGHGHGIGVDRDVTERAGEGLLRRIARAAGGARSEERRVGKEGSNRSRLKHCKKKEESSVIYKYC